MSKQKSKGEGNSPLEKLQLELENKYGGESVSFLSSPQTSSFIGKSTSTGSLVVDAAIQGGDKNAPLIPYGRQTELSGLPGSGKTSLCAQIAAEVQKQGGIVISVDTEERIDVPYWTKLGVDVSKVLSIHATTLDDVFNKQNDTLHLLLKNFQGVPTAMLWDSLGGTSSDEILEYDPNSKKKDTFMELAAQAYGRDAKKIGMGLKGLNPLISKAGVAYIYTNHVYNRMNVTYGDPLETPGGEKAKFFATLRIRLKRVGQLKVENSVGSDIIGHKVEIKTIKNSMTGKMAARVGYVLGGRGFCNDYSVFDIGSKLKIIEGSTWKKAVLGGEEVKFQGWNGFQEKIVTHPKYQELVDTVIASLSEQ